MQTFLPYPDFEQSMRSLDYRRLGKQRVECFQLLKALGDPDSCDLSDMPDYTELTINGITAKLKVPGWTNHPATKMWRGYAGLLAVYHDAAITEWVRRGYKNTMRLRAKPGPWPAPPWLGDAAFHASHRSNLLRKAPEHYGQFGWEEPDNLEYIWPV